MTDPPAPKSDIGRIPLHCRTGPVRPDHPLLRRAGQVDQGAEQADPRLEATRGHLCYVYLDKHADTSTRPCGSSSTPRPTTPAPANAMETLHSTRSFTTASSTRSAPTQAGRRHHRGAKPLPSDFGLQRPPSSKHKYGDMGCTMRSLSPSQGY